MERFRKTFTRSAYEPVEAGLEDQDDERMEEALRGGFSWLEYSIFLLLGIAMLWAW